MNWMIIPYTALVFSQKDSAADTLKIEPVLVRPDSVQTSIDSIVSAYPSWILSKIEFGNNHLFSFKGALGMDKKATKEALFKLLSLFSTQTGTNTESAKIQKLTEFSHPLLEIGLNIGYGRNSVDINTADSSSRVYREELPNGQEFYIVQENNLEKTESNETETVFALRTNWESNKNKIEISYLTEGSKETVKRNLQTIYNEDLRRVTDEQQGSGLWVRERLNMNTNVVTTLSELLELNKGIKNFLIKGTRTFNPNLEGILSVNLNNHSINTIDQNILRIQTRVTGNDTIIVEGNGISDTTIVPISFFDYQTQTSTLRNAATINTDYLHAMLRYGNTKKINGLLEFKQGVTRQDTLPLAWQLSKRLSFPIKRKMFNSLKAFIGENVFGFNAHLGFDFIPKEFIENGTYLDPMQNLAQYFKTLKELEGRGDLTDEQKEIFAQKAFNNYAKNAYGVYLTGGLAKIKGRQDTPTRVMWNIGAGYNAIDIFNILLKYTHDNYQNQHDISASANFKLGNNPFGAEIGYKTGNSEKAFRLGFSYNNF